MKLSLVRLCGVGGEWEPSVLCQAFVYCFSVDLSTAESLQRFSETMIVIEESRTALVSVAHMYACAHSHQHTNPCVHAHTHACTRTHTHAHTYTLVCKWAKYVY